jgi:pyrroloquinoline quinone biosynthesis protein E
VTATALQPPLALVAELTFRCPLRCGYCSNPLDLGRGRDELTTEQWRSVFSQAASLGVLQLHLSGGEPLLRDDLETLAQHATDSGLYTNVITSAWGLTPARIDALARAGVAHVQISLQDSDAVRADAIAGTAAHNAKLEAARAVHKRGIALSINAVLHRGNIDHTGEIIALAHALGATRLELANTQMHGWALTNRDALLPSRAQLDRAFESVRAARAQLGNAMQILWVLPDYHTGVPRPCVGGWGARFLTVSPDGRVLPCGGAHELPLEFPHVNTHTLEWAWNESPVFTRFRGESWMRAPCDTCPERARDHGGCRCQAFALTGDLTAADPACALSPHHALVRDARDRANTAQPRDPGFVPASLVPRTRR